MPSPSITTTAAQYALDSRARKSITFTGDLAGTAIYYLRCRKLKSATVSSTNFDYAVGAGTEKTFDIINDDPEIVRSAWFAISDTATKIIGVSES